jgi:hypothetical protein
MAVPVNADPSGEPDPFAKPSDPEARKHLVLGNKLYGVRSFDEAAAEYKAGAIIEPAPVFDYNLGQCYRLTNRYQEAIWHYERFLSRGRPAGEVLSAVQEFISQMKAELDKKATKQPPVEAAPPPSSTNSTTAEPSTRPSERTASAVLQPAAKQSSETSEAWYQDRWGWALTGGGVIGIAVGGGLLLNAQHINNQANVAKSQQEYGHLHDQASTRNLEGLVVGIGGAGLLATGIIKLMWRPSSARTRPQARWDVAPSRNGVTFQAKF